MICRKCKLEKSDKDMARDASRARGIGYVCRKCSVKKTVSYHNTPNGQITKRRARLKYSYGITPEQYEALVIAQNGKCAICESDRAGGRWDSRLAIDHDHATGKVRGLLCNACNNAIGGLKDDPRLLERAADYIRRNK